MEINIQTIIEYLKRAYLSMDNPNFAFVEKALSRSPFETLKKQLQTRFQIVDDTDTNDDVSFVFQLTNGNNDWVLQLSMVGPFAALFRVEQRGTCLRILTPANESLLDSEREIMNALGQNEVSLLDLDILSQKVPLRLFNADPGHVHVFQALFSDTDVLPWESNKSETDSR